MIKKLILYSGFIILFAWWVYRKLYHPDETGVYRVSKSEMVIFDTIEGPAAPLVAAKETLTSWREFSSGSTSRVAILLTDTTTNWLALVHGFKSAGIPFLVTQNYKAALRHQMVVVYPSISGRVMKAEALKATLEHPRNGGILLAFNVTSEGVSEVFGFQKAISQFKKYELRLERTAPENSFMSNSDNWIVKLGNKEMSIDPVGTVTYVNPQSTPLAYVEDNSAIIVTKSYAVGRSYAIGIDLGYFLHRSYNNIRDQIDVDDKKVIEPTSDVLLNLIKNIYVQNCRRAVAISPVPENKKLTVVFTHNVTTKAELFNAFQFAYYEQKQKIHASYFVQAKYISDFNGEAFIRPEFVKYLRKMREWGMDIGSLTVSANKKFNLCSQGNGKETYPEYRPYVFDAKKAYNTTLTGEVRVSKFLLDKVMGYGISGFRTPTYNVPRSLPQLLQGCNYGYSSSTTTSRAFTHRPFPLNYSYDSYSETNLFEFPVTINDHFSAGQINERLGETIEMAYDLAAYQGMMLISLNPDTLAKLEFEQRLIDSVKDFSWIGSLEEYASWWSARNQVEVDMDTDSIIEINLPVQMKGLTLQLPKGMRMYKYEPSNLPIDPYDDHVWIYNYQGKARLFLTRNPL